MRVYTSIFVLTAVLGLQACATYEQPSKDEPYAEAVFNRGAGEGGNVFSQGRLVSYYIAKNETCSEAPRVAFFGTGDLSGNEKSVRLVPGEPLKMLAFIQVNDAGFESGQYQRTGEFKCTSEIEFTPVSGAKYDIVLSLANETCLLNVTNQASGSMPDDLVQSDSVCASKPNMIPD